MKVKNTKTLDPWLHVFFYGDTGSGKTHNASTFPKPLFIVPQNEQSQTTLMGRDFDYIEVTGPHGGFNESTGQGGMFAEPTANGQGPDGIIDKLEKLYRKNPNEFPWETLVFESTTHYAELVQEYISKGGTKAIDQLGWGKYTQHFRSLHTRLRAIQVHVVFTALAEVKVLEKSKTEVGAPMLSGKSKNLLPSACDIIGFCKRIPGYMDKERTIPRHRVFFRPEAPYYARTRFKAMPEYVDQFSFDKIERFCRNEQ
jgi:hypothetical protein